jgi:hypothetical protein
MYSARSRLPGLFPHRSQPFPLSHPLLFSITSPQCSTISAMVTLMDQAFMMPHAPPFSAAPLLISGALYSPVTPTSLETELSPSVSSQSSYYGGSPEFRNGPFVLGGIGIARESQAQWSTVGSDSNSSKNPLERLGFKLHLGGEKKTRGWLIIASTRVPGLTAHRWPTTETKRPEARQQARAHAKAGTQPTGAEVDTLFT